MKVLHVALNYLGVHQYGLLRMLQSLGEYHQFDWMAEQKKGHMAMQLKLKQFANQIKPDLVFFQIQGSEHFDYQTIAAIPGFKINWTGDVRDDLPQWYIDLAPAFSITLFSNMRDVHAAREAGMNADYLQIGYDEQIYFPVERKKKYDVVFQGNHYGHFPLSKFRLDACVALREVYGDRFGLFGANYPLALKAKNTMGDPGAEARAYHEAHIGINISHYQIERYTSDRMHRIIGCGCFCLSHAYQDSGEEFPWLVTFETIEQMMERVSHFLSSDLNRNQIAEANYKHVRDHHTWLARAADILRIMESAKSL